MTFWKLIGSILLVLVCTHPIVLGLVGLWLTLTTGKIDGLFAVLATPMTLAFFGIPGLIHCFIVIVPAYYGFSFFGRREWTPIAVFALGAAELLYLALRDPVPTGAIPGYDQTALGFAASSLIAWALFAFFRLGLRRRE